MAKVKNANLSEAMKGNKNALGNSGGRPPLYVDPQELEKKITEYFEWIKGEVEIKEGVRTTENKKAGTKTTETYEYEFWIRRPEQLTITGLAIYLGFESKQSMYDYAKKAEFSYSIKKALLKVENDYEKGLQSSHCTGVIFALKNMDWSDKSIHQLEGNEEKPLNILNLGDGIKPKK